MREEQLEIINKLGLHARAAAKLVGVANRFSANITLFNDQKSANAKSIMAVMMLAAAKGTTVKLHLEGNDADDAFNAIETLINNRFDESE